MGVNSRSQLQYTVGRKLTRRRQWHRLQTWLSEAPRTGCRWELSSFTNRNEENWEIITTSSEVYYCKNLFIYSVLYRTGRPVCHGTFVDCRGQFVGWPSLSTVWILGAGLRLSGVAAAVSAPSGLANLNFTHFISQRTQKNCY